MAKVGIKAFAEVLGQLYIDNPSREANFDNPRLDFGEIIQYAGDEFDPERWFLVSLNSDIAGLVMPQVLPDSKGSVGSLFYFGLIPEYRDKGYGRILHARGLEYLAAWGVKQYFGSTDVMNHSMIRIFTLHDCEKMGIRKLFKLHP